MVSTISFLDAIASWPHLFSTSLTLNLSVFALSLAVILWSAFQTRRPGSAHSNLMGTGANGHARICPHELLKDEMNGNGVANSYAFEHEVTVPFEVGDVRVSKILVHPIKSCRGTSVLEARYTPEGLENDRKWCIIEAQSHAIVTARETAKMVLITPGIQADSASPCGGRLVVTFPPDSGCETFSVPLSPTPDTLENWPIIDDCTMFGKYHVQGYVCSSLDSTSRSPSEVLSQYFERPVHLMMKGPRLRECPPTHAFPDLKATAVFQDGYPFLVASEESLNQVGRVVSTFAQVDSPQGQIGGIDRQRWREGAIEIERFRPNIVLKGSGVPFAEDMWRQILIHAAQPSESSNHESDETRTFTLVSKCARCLLPNVDTTTGERDAAVPYKVLLKFRKGKDPARMSKPCFGCNAVVGGSGTVRVDDRVEVTEWASGIGV